MSINNDHLLRAALKKAGYTTVLNSQQLQKVKRDFNVRLTPNNIESVVNTLINRPDFNSYMFALHAKKHGPNAPRPVPQPFPEKDKKEEQLELQSEPQNDYKNTNRYRIKSPRPNPFFTDY